MRRFLKVDDHFLIILNFPGSRKKTFTETASVFQILEKTCFWIPLFILFNKEALEKMIIFSWSNTFILYAKIPRILIFSLWEEILSQNVQIFPFLERAIFSLFSSRKDAYFFVFVTQKRYGNVTFSNYGNVRKSTKISHFRIYLFSRIYTMRKDVILCTVTISILIPLYFEYPTTSKFNFIGFCLLFYF